MIIIAGAGGHGVSVYSALSQMGLRIDYFYDDTSDGFTDRCGIPVRNCLMFPDNLEEFVDVYIAVGDGSGRSLFHNKLRNIYDKFRFPKLVHPTALVADSARLGNGVIVMPYVYIGPNCVVGDFSLLNTRSSLEHDSSMGYFASLAPSVTTGGSVLIGDFTEISIGTVISRATSVGSHSVIGAASYVHGNIPDGVLAYGTPSKVVRELHRDM